MRESSLSRSWTPSPMVRWCRTGSRSRYEPTFEKHMTSTPTTAALTLSLTGPFARQGTEAAEGVRLWAEAGGVRPTLVDDAGAAAAPPLPRPAAPAWAPAAAEAYAQWVDSIDLLLGPYSSGLVRAIAPLVVD